MRLPVLPRQLPPRIAIGAFILNSGLGKRHADQETAKGLHGMAAGAYPFLSDMDPQKFVRTLSTAEIALGSALLVPLVPTKLVACALTALSGGLVGMYLRTPGLTDETGIRPSQAGTAIAKDVFMLGSGLGLMVDEMGRAARQRAKHLRTKVTP